MSSLIGLDLYSSFLYFICRHSRSYSPQTKNKKLKVSGDAQTNSVIKRSRPYQAIAAFLFIVFIAAATASEFMSLAEASMCSAFGMLFARTLSRKQAMGAISARTLLVVGAGAGLTTALEQSGASQALAEASASLFGDGEFRLLLLGLFMVTSFLANVVSPMAAVSLMFPVAFRLEKANEAYRPEVILGVLGIDDP